MSGLLYCFPSRWLAALILPARGAGTLNPAALFFVFPQRRFAYTGFANGELPPPESDPALPVFHVADFATTWGSGFANDNVSDTVAVRRACGAARRAEETACERIRNPAEELMHPWKSWVHGSLLQVALACRRVRQHSCLTIFRPRRKLSRRSRQRSCRHPRAAVGRRSRQR